MVAIAPLPAERFDDSATGAILVPEMTILRGHVEGGRVVIDEEGELPDGAQVEIAVLTDEDEMTPEERAELLVSIDRGLEQATRGEGMRSTSVDGITSRSWPPARSRRRRETAGAVRLPARTSGPKSAAGKAAYPWGRMAVLADAFGNGFCLIELDTAGYGAIATLYSRHDE